MDNSLSYANKFRNGLFTWNEGNILSKNIVYYLNKSRPFKYLYETDSKHNIFLDQFLFFISGLSFLVLNIKNEFMRANYGACF